MPTRRSTLGRLWSMRSWRPSRWVSLSPNGLGHVKPNHYAEMVRTLWENRHNLGYAWRILSRGVCDGCALGTTGLRDFTLDGVHLCVVRLNLLKYNTMGALDVAALGDVGPLAARSSRELRALGRLPYPMIRRRGEPGFSRSSWDEALDLVADRVRRSEPDRLAFYLTSRGITNEVYYVAQKVARFLGTNNVDNSARLCHAPSTTALKAAIGVGASTCSYKDWFETDLLVFFGSDVAQNQPVTTKYLWYAQRNGARIVVVNPYREPGLERYWIPSVTESALFGTRLADAFYQVHIGGDIAFVNGALKHLIANDWIDRAFIDEHTQGFDDLRQALARQPWELLERQSGVDRESMLEFARQLAAAPRAIFVWSMGVTQHAFGTDNVHAIANLALVRGAVGRDGCGLMPIRGHSGVQGGAEVGAVPSALPGGVAVGSAESRRLEELWGFDLPCSAGKSARQMLEAAHAGELDLLYAAGGNYLETLPDPDYVQAALERVPLRVHQDIVVTSQMLVEPRDTVVLLPAATRYEQPGGGTETSTERQIIFSPEIPGRRVGEARPEWEPFVELGKRAKPAEAHLIDFGSTSEIRAEIARAVPFYAGIETLARQGDHIQWGGRHLAPGGRFPTADGRARLLAVAPPARELPPGRFALATRRGKQFNSMVHADHDPLTGGRRDHVFMAASDAEALGLEPGARVIVRNPRGELSGRIKIAAIRPGNLQVFWPEANVLLDRHHHDGPSGIPDYNTIVEVVPVASGHRAAPTTSTPPKTSP